MWRGEGRPLVAIGRVLYILYIVDSSLLDALVAMLVLLVVACSESLLLGPILLVA